MSTVDYPMQTMPAATRRLGGFKIRVGEPFIIASREENPVEGKFCHPVNKCNNIRIHIIQSTRKELWNEKH